MKLLPFRPLLFVLVCASLVFGTCCGKRETSSGVHFTQITADLPQVGAGPSCAWGDYDNDGDLDLVASGRDAGWAPLAQVSENTGGVFVCKDVGLTGVSPCSVAWADYDRDGFLDLAIAGNSIMGGASRFYINTGARSFTQSANLPSVLSCASAWGDYDNDGDPDLAIAGDNTGAGSFITKILRNDSGTFTEVASLTGIACCSLAWGDYNNDGRLELLMVGATNNTTFDPICKIVSYDGIGVFTEKDVGIAGVYNCNVAWGDCDGDGDLDIAMVGKDQGGDTVCCVCRNLGSDVFTQIPIDTGTAGGGALAWGDYDNDGDLDLAATDVAGPGLPTIYLNNGTGSFTPSGLVLSGGYPVACADYDDDGDLDIAIGGLYKTYLWRNDCSHANTPPNAPGNLNAVVSGSDVTLSWDPATDAETPSAGLTYNIKVRTDSGGNDDVVPCMSDPVTGKRRIPAMGNVQLNKSWTIKGLAPGTYHWTVQSVDNCYAGSSWATEQSFTIP